MPGRGAHTTALATCLVLVAELLALALGEWPLQGQQCVPTAGHPFQCEATLLLPGCSCTVHRGAPCNMRAGLCLPSGLTRPPQSEHAAPAAVLSSAHTRALEAALVFTSSLAILLPVLRALRAGPGPAGLAWSVEGVVPARWEAWQVAQPLWTWAVALPFRGWMKTMFPSSEDHASRGPLGPRTVYMPPALCLRVPERCSSPRRASLCCGQILQSLTALHRPRNDSCLRETFTGLVGSEGPPLSSGQGLLAGRTPSPTCRPYFAVGL